jgi:carbonic anhydrase/acetyltransferase-like protein (isoleucine patch superfamily)
MQSLVETMIRSHKGKTPKIGKNVYIDPMALVIGDVTLGDDCSVWPGAVIRGDVNKIVIGNRCNIQDNVVIHTSHSVAVYIGDNVTIGHLAHVHSATIGNGVMVGSRSVVLDECVIEDQCLIGAGALVSPRSKIPSNSMVLGMPAVIKRELKVHEITMIMDNAQEYVDMKNDYLAGQLDD